MTKFAPLAIGLALAGTWAGSAAIAADKVDLTGTWIVTIEIGGQQGMPEFELKQDGDKLTGKYKGQFGEKDVKGKVTDDEVEFSFEVQDGAEAVYKGKIDGETMKGTADYAGQASGDWTAERKKGDK
jgi:hypothetical protein